ncbi:MAG: hypothetical protein M3503_07300 [Actinomycetota bacterium]|nr:hypothetical protein [Actinomycetota bacterium]
MRRSPALLALVLLVPLAACGGDDDEAAQDDQETEVSESETEPAETESSETESDGTESESERSSGGEGGEVSADAYADGVCTSISGWYESIESSSRDLVEEAGTLSADPATGKEIVLRFLDDTIDLTETLVADLEEVGVPDTSTGQETADKLVSGIGDVRDLFSQARDDTAALPTEDEEAIVSGLQDIGTALQESATAVGANFEEVLSSVDDPELAEAFETTPSCSELTPPA